MPSENNFGGVFNRLAEKSTKDKFTRIARADDIQLSSYVPFGILSRVPSLDLALQRPGYPAGRVVEFYGAPACGKSSLALQAIAETQREGGAGLIIDTEATFDPKRAQTLGVNTDPSVFGVSSCESLEAIFRTIDRTVDTLTEMEYEQPFTIVVDSVTSVSSEREFEGEFGDSIGMGLEARVIKAGMRRVNPKLAKQKVLLIMVNHSIATLASYGRRSRSAGGNAIKYYASLRVELAAIKTLKDGDDLLGQRIKLTVEKLKGAPLKNPSVEVDFFNETGFDTEGSLLDAMISVGLVSHAPKSRSYTFVPEKREFARTTFPSLIEDLGGLAKAYAVFIEAATRLGVMAQWGMETTL